ncbi:hypothetical protein JQN72_08445 [Phycicoccus sp. CSK15P-2]|uniref:hypothetical protein n=1 Tax=Phycicoccus sp. CSK15P-2 TaxID=2807627 RepID=UPI00194F93D9|nr:hypothetical protein [Phycicoccus sp. CSK15P-2]MBM6404270.1 hypothetical protein [Phycicoccus sp. CSK15P-2]
MTSGETTNRPAREVVVDGTLRRSCVRAVRRQGRVAAIVFAVVIGPLLLGLLLSVGLDLPTRLAFLVGALASPLVALVFTMLRGRDTGRALRVGDRVTLQLEEDGLRFGPAGREVPLLFEQMRRLDDASGHLLVTMSDGGDEPVCIPAALLEPGDLDLVRSRLADTVLAPREKGSMEAARPPASSAGVTEHVTAPTEVPARDAPPEEPVLLRRVLVDADLADRVSADAAHLISRRRRPLFVAAPLLALLVVALPGVQRAAPYLVSATFVVTVAVRWAGPFLVRRRVRQELLPRGADPYPVVLTPASDGFVLESHGRSTQIPWRECRSVRALGSAVVILGREWTRLVVPADACAAGLVQAGTEAVRHA